MEREELGRLVANGAATDAQWNEYWTPPRPESMTTVQKEKKGGPGGIILAAILVLGWLTLPAAFHAIDEIGWIRHSQDTPVRIGGEWMVGEYRNCLLDTNVRDFMEPAGRSVLDCWGSARVTEHTLPIIYWGRIDRKDVAGWRCQRQSDSITCKAIN